MRAAYMEKVGDFHFEDRPEPMVSEDYDVKIKVVVTGICGSEVHAFHGKHALRVPPVVSGHEYSGVVVEVGDKVTQVKVGDRVTSEPHYGCGECELCKKGMYHICNEKKILGCGSWSGSFGEYVVVPEQTVIKLGDNVSFEEGALIEPLAVGIHAVKESGLKENMSALIIGGGPIGLCIAQSAMLKGVGTIIVADINDDKLEIAKKCGATDVINTLKEDIVQKTMEITNNRGVDVTLLTFVNEGIIDNALDCTISAGVVSEVAIVTDKYPIAIGKIQHKEIKFMGSNMYVMDDFKEICEGIDNGKLKLDIMISKILPIEECTEAMDISDKKIGNPIKVMMKF